MFNKTCLICGKEFQSKAQNARYCSHECKLIVKRNKRDASRGPSKTFKRLCESCGEPFETKVATKKYCSDECYRLATAARKRAKRTKTRRVTGKLSEDAFQGLCSVCGADDVPVSECPECGYLCCEKCRDKSGICSVCSDEQIVHAICVREN